MLFEDDEILVVPNTISINKKIESEGSEFLPTQIIKDVIKRCEDIVIMNSCLCRSSNNCQDYPQDIGCIFLGPTSRKIPKHVGKRATVEEALAQVDRADAAGLSHIIGRKVHHFHHLAFKVFQFGRVNGACKLLHWVYPKLFCARHTKSLINSFSAFHAGYKYYSNIFVAA